MSIKSFLGVEEMKRWKVLLKQLFAEFLGTFLYLAICNLVVSDRGRSNVAVAFANGLLISSIVLIVGHVSGGHINPAVTVGVMIGGYIKPLRAVCYVAVQSFGSIAGTAVAYAISENSTRGILGVTLHDPDLRVDQVFALELLMTFILVAVALAVGDLNRGPKGLGSAPLAIGLSITACQCACLSYSGSLNPARSLGPAVILNVWTDHWVYWLGPMMGGVLAGVVYTFILNFNLL